MLHPQARERLCAVELAPTQRGGLAAHAGERCALPNRQLQSLLGLIVTLVDSEDGTPVAVTADVRGKAHELKTSPTTLSLGLRWLNQHPFRR